MCQRQWGEPEERVESRRVHLQLSLVAAVIWTEETLPTLTWKVARGYVEACRYKALLWQMPLPSETLAEIPVSLVPGLFAQVLTHGTKLCNVLPHLGTFTTSLTTAPLSTCLCGRADRRVSHFAAPRPKQPHASDPWRLLLEFPQQ